MKRIKILLMAKKAGIVTEPYPYKPVEPPEGFRGKPYIDPDKCVGCGSCASVCPPNAIQVVDLIDKGYRRIELFIGRCIFCGRCSEICPEDAIELTKEFELASKSQNDMYQVVLLKMVKCKICGRYFTTQRNIEKLLKELPKDLWDTILVCPECKEKSTAYTGSYAKR